MLSTVLDRIYPFIPLPRVEKTSTNERVRVLVSKLWSHFQQMKSEGGVTIKSRTQWFSTYPKCFVGSAAVEWLMTKEKAANKQEAVAIGQQMVEEDLVHHVQDNKGFSDDSSWFRFRSDDEPEYNGMSYFGQAKSCVRAGPLRHKQGFGWNSRHVVITQDPPQFLQYDNEYAAKPSKVIDLKQAALDVSECEDCKKDWHCFTLSGGDHQIREVYCAQKSKDQQAWMEALISQGVTMQQEDLHSTAESLFEFNASKHDGTVVNFSEFAALYNKYHKDGFEILAFPSNEFGKQEPKSNEEIQQFVAERGVKFPVFAKTTVNGKHAHPVFTFLRSKLTGLLGAYIKWNFTKFICDRDGIPVKRYAPTTKPNECEADIVELLGKPATKQWDAVDPKTPAASSTATAAAVVASAEGDVVVEHGTPRKEESHPEQESSSAPTTTASEETKPENSKKQDVDEAFVQEPAKKVDVTEETPTDKIPEAIQEFPPPVIDE